MSESQRSCPDCESADYINVEPVTRRKFLVTSSAAALAASAVPTIALGADKKPKTAETYVEKLYNSFTPDQKSKVCFDWDHVDGRRGLLRTRVANNWQITRQSLNSEFYTADQRDLVRAIFEGIIAPDWHKKIDKQLQDDGGGFGRRMSVGIFGKPGDGKFEFVLTGRHCTLRCDGNSAEHVAFGGPIFYGHAADGFNEGPEHRGNVFWPQAIAANGVFKMLDGKQRKQALVANSPREQQSDFRRGRSEPEGMPVAEMSKDQQDEVEKVLAKLLEPYRNSDREEVAACLKAQGGLEKCHLAFYADSDIGDDGVWDNWRLEGPAFVWHFRGKPHVHCWVNVAADPSVKLNA
ncbi:MAG: DUF3500 domain-containing protein [Pirellulales bacterium]|nr:DUF3500 domain-containing protein [Pirellulales bacterium]